jgi:chorismate mutase/prephenate dehydratase
VIWREILSASLALEHPLPVAYLGPPGTFTHLAATRRFGSSAQLLPVPTIAEIFDEVERNRAEFGVVPVENSTEGAVNVTLDRLIDSDVTITGEMNLDISQHLISRATELAAVKMVCSHPQGLAQCRAWLAAHLPEAAMEETASTSAAVERARDDATVAAVASDIAAQVHGVPILRPRIEDNPSNSTRFLVIGRKAVPPTGRRAASFRSRSLPRPRSSSFRWTRSGRTRWTINWTGGRAPVATRWSRRRRCPSSRILQPRPDARRWE